MYIRVRQALTQLIGKIVPDTVITKIVMGLGHHLCQNDTKVMDNSRLTIMGDRKVPLTSRTDCQLGPTMSRHVDDEVKTA